MAMVDICSLSRDGVTLFQHLSHGVARELQSTAVGVMNDEHVFELDEYVQSQQIIEQWTNLTTRAAEDDGILPMISECH
jgi:hypothetical protein